jgi:peptide/nickel transport system ATP-binding protein
MRPKYITPIRSLICRERIILKGELPSPLNPPSGCVFRTRCPEAMELCGKITPELEEVKAGRFVACHLYKKES